MTEGKLDELKGRVKEATGNLTGNGKLDELKGRVKEATGSLTGDKRPERKGKREKAAASAKAKTSQFIDRIKKPFQRTS